MTTWTKKDERQYEAIKESLIDQGKTGKAASKVAARTVNKQRRLQGLTPNNATQGAGNPYSNLDDRTVDELRNIVRKLKIVGRSKLTKKQDLIKSIRAHRT